MAVTQISSIDQALNEDDVVFRQRQAHRAKVYDKGVFTNADVTIDFGPQKAKEKITLRYEIGSSFAFACYQDNPKWHDRGHDEWMVAATDALEKFCAARDLQIIDRRPEITNRYNMFVEVRGVVA